MPPPSSNGFFFVITTKDMESHRYGCLDEETRRKWVPELQWRIEAYRRANEH